MSKAGPLLPILGGLGGLLALGSGLGAAGIGPLSGLFSAGDAGLTAGTAGADALASAGGAATEGLAVAAPTALDAGAGFLVPGTDTALAAAPVATGSVADFLPSTVGGALPGAASAGSLIGDVTPASNIVADAGPTATGGFSDVGLGASSVGPNTFFSPGTSSPWATGTPAGGVADFFSSPATDLSSVGAPALPTGGSDFSGGGGGGDAGGGGGGGDFASGGTPWWQRPSTWLMAAPLALAGGQMLFGGNTVPGSGPVTAAAQTAAQNEGILTGQGMQNMSYVNTGALPAGAQAEIDSAANAAKAQVRSSFASMGIPPGSTMESQQLAAVDENAAVQKFDIQQKLLQAGISQFNTAGSFGGLVNQADLALMNAQIQQEQELEAALANFAGAAAAGWNFGNA